MKIEIIMENNKFNKILLICNAVLFLGLIGIYILHFTGKGETTDKTSKVNVNAKAPVVKDGLKIAYVNTDSLLAKYQYAKDLEANLMEFRNQQEAYGKQQMDKFQKDYQDYLKNGANMTLSQQQAKEAELKKRAEKMATLEQELTAKIMQRQIEENTNLLNVIFANVREYNEQNQQFDIILRKTFENSPTLYMNAETVVDITDEIIDQLNKDYNSTKK